MSEFDEDERCPECREPIGACLCVLEHEFDCRHCGRPPEDCDCEQDAESLRMWSRIEAWRAEDARALELLRDRPASPPTEEAPPFPPILTFSDLLGPERTEK